MTSKFVDTIGLLDVCGGDHHCTPIFIIFPEVPGWCVSVWMTVNVCMCRFMCWLQHLRFHFRLATKPLIQSENGVMTPKDNVFDSHHSFEKYVIHFAIGFGLSFQIWVGKQQAWEVHVHSPGLTLRFASQYKIDAVKVHAGDLEGTSKQGRMIVREAR